jgi:hypothetical protein
MIRLILRLFKIKDFEVCASCAVLKEQLEFERAEKRQLTETLITIVRPRTFEAPVQELNPIVQTSGLFSKRRAALEARDREEAMIKRNSTNLGKPDDKIAALESELGVEEVGVN